MVNIFEYTDYRKYLKDYFNESKEKHKYFSHRWLSKRLGLSTPNLLLLVMQGKRNLTRTLAYKVSDEFKHSPKETEYFICLIDFAQAVVVSEKNRYFNRIAELRSDTNVDKIEENQYECYSNWYNLAIRELITHPDFKGDPNWLAKKLLPHITATQAKHSLELLLRLGLIKKKGTAYSQSSEFASTGPQVSSFAIANFHQTMAQQAATAMDIVPKKERNMTACTVNISQKGFEKIKEAIAECRKKILTIAKTDSQPNRVYHAHFHLFPLSVREKTKAIKE